ncbi:hypothetical protein KGQ20_16190 [Catenulispora sp. NF23]|uniref:hypothetical protein n=1 Tax=Catenulispora pinistramenti TaxID=2705254 RepID=UPI001BAD9770|nr:hypothetical protein [Catenulispora pinistramenti]MBS2534312.1 hypothetical protein [Catenulispora pinistramenti]
MNALNRIALLAGGALVAVAATGCSSSTKSAGAGPATSPTNASGTTAAASTSASVPNTTAGSTSAPAGGSASTPPAAGNTPPSTNSGVNGGEVGNGSTTAPAANTPPPAACQNASLNASLAPSIPGQKSSVFVIAVKNTGQTCTLGPIPYVWITKSPTDVSDEARPLIPGVDTGKKNIILSGTTLYAAIDLLPGNLASTTGNYGDLAVTANPTPNTSGKDVQDVVIPAGSAEGNAKLGVYALNPASAINQIQYATTAEK